MMGNAKRRGSYIERKNNPLGKKSNHMKNRADLKTNSYIRFFEALKEKMKQEMQKKMGGR